MLLVSVEVDYCGRSAVECTSVPLSRAVFSFGPRVVVAAPSEGRFYVGVAKSVDRGDNVHRMQSTVAHLEDERLAREAQREDLLEGVVQTMCPHCGSLVNVSLGDSVGEPIAEGVCDRCGCAFKVITEAA